MATHNGETEMNEHAFSYDKEQDDLFIYNPNEKSSGSVEIGNIIIDYNSKKEIVGIQFIQATTFLSEIVNEDIKEVLQNLMQCSLHVVTQNNISIIKINLKTKNKEFEPIISIPTITEKSPALQI